MHLILYFLSLAWVAKAIVWGCWLLWVLYDWILVYLAYYYLRCDYLLVRFFFVINLVVASTRWGPTYAFLAWKNGNCIEFLMSSKESIILRNRLCLINELNIFPTGKCRNWEIPTWIYQLGLDIFPWVWKNFWD